ncbi:cobalamin biosynthesis protein [Acidocella aquatica]|nr:cobalamin biosynthesis protein [Acidocella aquatica]
MGGGETMIAAGVGFSSGALAEEIEVLVRLTERRAGQNAEVLAAPDFKDCAPLRAAAAALRLPLILLGRVALEAAQPHCATHSDLAGAAVGLASVAEACALAAAGAKSRLLVARLAQGRATCALAGNLP